jgi:succinate dehydrogenase / fumarate reductase cytochrome b subunit
MRRVAASPAPPLAAPSIPEERTQRGAAFLGSTVGKKAVMAVTGVVLVGFVLGHMLGNLQLYLGPAALNAYGRALRELGHGGALWVVRAVLLVSVGLHVWAATSLFLVSRAARPVSYRRERFERSTYASRTMRWSGPILLLFVLYHLAHFTVGNAHPAFVEGDVFHNVVTGFRSGPVVLFYEAAMLALGLHLYHGVWSMLQTLGLSHPRYNRWRQAVSALVTLLVVGGNLSFPLAVYFRLVG